jgi:LmbE family N-acetylglucosaminyl deacetylase
MKNKIPKISYGKNVYDNKEINAVIKTLNNSTQMGRSVSTFENKISKLFSKKFGYNQDHRATFQACITALRPSPLNVRHMVKNVLVYEEPYTWTINSAFKPNIYLNTEEVENEKITLMRLHKSQDRPFPFARSAENLISRMRIRGSECGLKSAEAYYLLRGNFE